MNYVFLYFIYFVCDIISLFFLLFNVYWMTLHINIYINCHKSIYLMTQFHLMFMNVAYIWAY